MQSVMKNLNTLDFSNSRYLLKVCSTVFNPENERENDHPQDCYSERYNCCSSQSAHKVVCSGDTYTLGGQSHLLTTTSSAMSISPEFTCLQSVSKVYSLKSHYYFVPVPRKLYKGCIIMSLK